MLFSKNTSDFERAHQIITESYENLDQTKVEIFNSGFDHAVLVVDGTRAFRFPKNDEYLQKLKITTSFLKEFAPISPVPVPQSELYVKDGITFEVYDFLKGEPLDESLAALWPTDDISALGRRLGNFLTSLHSFPVDRAKTMGVPEHHPLRRWQERYRAIEKRVLPEVDQRVRGEIKRVFEQFLDSLADDISLRTIHADIKPDHIIVNIYTRELTGVIDFGDMEIGDPAEDFTFFDRYQLNITPFVLEGYGLETDPEFLERVTFYQTALPIMDFLHALEVGLHDKTEEYRKRLSLLLGQ